MESPDRQRRFIQACGMAAMVGTQLVASLLVGYAIGYWLDRWLGTSPVMVVVWVFAGMAAGFTELFKTVLKFSEDDRKDDGK